MDARSDKPRENSFWSFPYVAPAHPSSTDFHGNLARATEVLLAVGVDPGQKDDSFENEARFHDVHVS